MSSFNTAISNSKRNSSAGRYRYRFQQWGLVAGCAPAQGSAGHSGNAPWRRRTSLDVFDQTQRPKRRALRALGNEAVIATPRTGSRRWTAGPMRQADVARVPRSICRRWRILTHAPPQRAVPPSAVASAGSVLLPTSLNAAPSPPPQARNVVPATPDNQRVATLPPSASPG